MKQVRLFQFQRSISLPLFVDEERKADPGFRAERASVVRVS